MISFRQNIVPLIIPIVISGLLLLASIHTCERFEPEAKLKVRTDSVTSVSVNAFSIEGNIVYVGESEIIQHGFCYAVEIDPAVDVGVKNELGKKASTGAFRSDFSGLDPNTTYKVKAYATDQSGTAYGIMKTFATPAPSLPTVTTAPVSNVTSDSAQSGGTITSDGGAAVTARGVCWGLTINPTITDDHTSDETGVGDFTSSISGLECDTTYYLRAYATNSEGTGYGDEVSFTTLECQQGLPELTTRAATNVTGTSATVGGNITDEGASSVSERGIFYGTSSNPVSTGSKVTVGNGAGEFSTTLTGLSGGTIYYFVAFATNGEGTSLGSELSFTTDIIVGAPVVETNAATSVGETSATINGNVTDDGGNTVTERGFYYGPSADPVTSGTRLSEGDGTGSFSASLTGLSLGTTYYFVAFATNDSGTSYGSELYFTTLTSDPSVTTSSATSITETSARIGGNVTDDGGSPITDRGIYYGTSSNLQSTGTRVSEGGNGTGAFSVQISGLSPGTTYYHLAYATGGGDNIVGITLDFTTLVYVPTVFTLAASSVTSSSAVVGGNVTDDGGGTISERGFYYGTSSNPMSTGTKVQAGNGTGTYSTTLPALSPQTRYYFVAYAVNERGTALGEERSFDTKAITVTDYDGNVYQTVQIGSQVWMAENLKVTRYENGQSIQYVSSFPGWHDLLVDDKAYCWAFNEVSSIYGMLYSWAGAMNGASSSNADPSGVQGVCPDGWHLPSDPEWKQMEKDLGMSQAEADGTSYRGTDEGGKLKEEETAHWNDPNTGATNTTGFTALPASYRDWDGQFGPTGQNASFWTTTEASSSDTWNRVLFDNFAGVYRSSYNKIMGLSVRCVKDD
jgi:uncharacterized protein (TIGR02145 family)